MHDALAVSLMIAAAIVLPMAPIFLIGLWERRMVWPYVLIDEHAPVAAPMRIDSANPYAAGSLAAVDPTPPITPYAARTITTAAQLGFRSLGVFRDGKGRIYQVRYDFLLSRERDVLALIGSGTIAGIRLNNTWLFTRLADGRCLRTVDTQPGSEIDLAGLADEALIAGVDFEELTVRHRNRAAVSFASPIAYSDDDPLRDHREFCVRRANALEELGYVRFLDSQRTTWRYRARGALLWTLRAHFQGLRRAVWSDARLKPGAGSVRRPPV